MSLPVRCPTNGAAMLARASSTGSASTAPATPPDRRQQGGAPGEARRYVTVGGAQPVDDLDRLASCDEAGTRGNRDHRGRHRRDQQQRQSGTGLQAARQHRQASDPDAMALNQRSGCRRLQPARPVGPVPAPASASRTAITAGSGNASRSAPLPSQGRSSSASSSSLSGRASATPGVPTNSATTRSSREPPPCAAGSVGSRHLHRQCRSGTLLPMTRQRRRADPAAPAPSPRGTPSPPPGTAASGRRCARRRPSSSKPAGRNRWRERARAICYRAGPPGGHASSRNAGAGWRPTRASLWVATTTVVPSRFISLNNCISRSAWASSRLPVGSSASSRFGPIDHRAGDRDALLLAAGQFRRTRARLFRQADPAQHFADIRADLPFRPPGDAQRQGDVVECRQMRQQAEILKHHADSPAQPRQSNDARPCRCPCRGCASLPRVGRTARYISRSRLVLPAPDGRAASETRLPAERS